MVNALSRAASAGRTSAYHPVSAYVDGWPINVATQAHAVDALVAAARAGEGFSCLTLNLDHLVKLRTNPRFRQAYRAARFVTADGAPVAALAQRQWPEVRRTTGADLLVPLAKAAAVEGIPIHLFGTSDEVLDRTAAELRRLTGGKIVIAGMEAPPQGFDPDHTAADAAIARIAASGARLCFVLLGAPKQEIFAARAVEAGLRCGFVCVGAAADFIAGSQSRAPQAFQALGLEWLWRLGGNPRRLGARYARCALVLARIVWGEMARSRRGMAARM